MLTPDKEVIQSCLPKCKRSIRNLLIGSEVGGCNLFTKGVDTVIIAATYENGQVFQHFGHTEQFKIYNVENGEIAESEVIDTNGSGHGALVGLLSTLKVDVLLCGGIGGGARMALEQTGIRLFGGVQGNADSAVEAFVSGTLAYDPNAKCDHHEHGEGHSCGDYGSGSHNCGSHSCQ